MYYRLQKRGALLLIPIVVSLCSSRLIQQFHISNFYRCFNISQCLQILNMRNPHRRMLCLLAIIATLMQLTLNCDPNCAFCKDNSQGGTTCLACSTGYTLTQSGFCIAETTTQNCATYDSSQNCIACKPTFQSIWNTCQRMFDGCLIYKSGKCIQCLPGGILSPMSGCSVQYLNCIQIDSQGVCLACQPKYTLNNGKCFYQSNCSFVDKNTGLCTQCSPNWLLVSSSCIPSQKMIDNCYVIDDSQANYTCKYCKQGYGVVNGTCQIFADIINSTRNLTENCSNPEYLQFNQTGCLGLGSNCLMADFGSSTCAYCQSGYILVNGSCILMANNFCLTFANGNSCQTCKPTFFLRNGQCNPYPPNCISFTFTCTQCQSNFQLVNGNCVDPNCQTINPITRACQICVVNYKLNPNGVCKFMDPNCQQFNSNGDCLQCLNGYSVKSSMQYCVYQDVNCLTFNNVTGGCTMCKPFFSYNEQVQLCVPLPDYCLTGDMLGRCSSCMAGYTLISNYNCLWITPAVPNCKIVSKDNFTKCVLCNNGSYSANGVCRPLPVFCALYDSVNNQCQQCNDNGLLRNGACVDKNCQIFDLDGGCLACIPSYQFNSFGQCIFTAKDPNCKNFVFGICQLCFERFYFNFQFVCTAVSPLCKTYDSNSGFCLSCYDGYELNVNGGCFINTYYSIVGNSDFLTSSCKSYNNQGECTECLFGYQAFTISNFSKGVNCIQNFQSNSSYCIDMNLLNGKCRACVSRMFVNSSGQCQSIDQNCDKYNQTTGSCITCYPGYENQFDQLSNKTRCKIISDADPNCQIKANSTGCQKCYSGFYYSVENIKCVQVNQLCNTYNTVNGQCLSCYSGYNLFKGNCKLSPTAPTTAPTTINNITNQTSAVATPTPVGCLQINSTTNKCSDCETGYALINGNCIQRDMNCQKFVSQDSLSCASCYQGYKPFGNDQSQCVLATLVVDHCIKYSGTSNPSCINCENGFILFPNPAGTSPPFSCTIVDQNCLVFNSTVNACQTCSQGTVLSGRFCIVPTYGVDPNCILYTNKLCTVCKTGWTIVGYLCTQN